MDGCEDCSVNGVLCEAHGRTVAVPVIGRLLEYAGDHEDDEAVGWLYWLRDTLEGH